ncbi:hypothetical protein NE237_012004 [Protea cynaroides]|uniref:WRKY domain-containing protein n=1 Tax=Protea cynaroides TaxID=273540 RepID=A0A9Q0GVZ6_9MAGN|nr:hypothetical protein NE237_012004 [Protea cynaroides]
MKNEVLEKKESMTTISFSASPIISAANSFMSSLTGDTDSKYSSSLKRKCSSSDDAASKCRTSSGRCHCSKRRKSRVKRVVRVPAISLKMADIPTDEYSWRKYGQKPIKGSPHPRFHPVLSSSSPFVVVCWCSYSGWLLMGFLRGYYKCSTVSDKKKKKGGVTHKCRM